MMGGKVWRRRRSPAAKKKTRAAAERVAEEYRSGRKVRRYESPAMIAKHGRAPWPPEKAAAWARDNILLAARVSDRYPALDRELHRARKASAAKASRRGGSWSLYKANVTRDKRTGQFRSR